MSNAVILDKPTAESEEFGSNKPEAETLDKPTAESEEFVSSKPEEEIPDKPTAESEELCENLIYFSAPCAPAT